MQLLVTHLRDDRGYACAVKAALRMKGGVAAYGFNTVSVQPEYGDSITVTLKIVWKPGHGVTAQSSHLFYRPVS
ncbi:hypothetical protein A0J51_02616 [Gluconobacter japonicus]|nr:hypothetical protein A0J51_02616 [Gluconobacter japonicus]